MTPASSKVIILQTNMNTNLFLLLIININLYYVFGIPVSPCPNIFLYKFDQNLWHGEIHLAIAPSAGKAMLRVRYSVAYSITRVISTSFLVQKK